MATPSRLDSFPAELLLQICDLLNLRDIKAVRFLLRKFAAAGLHYVMRHQSFVLAPKSIERLEAITKDPVCSRMVWCLAYEMDTLVKPLRSPKQSSSGWNIGDTRDTWNENEHYDLHDQDFRLAWDRSHEIARFQLRLDSNLAERRRIYEQILRGLPNLNTICLNSEMATIWSAPSCRRFYGATLVGPKENDFRKCHHGADQLEDFLLVAAGSAKSVNTLRAFYISWLFFERLARIKNIHEMEPALQRLKRLSLAICLEKDPSSEELRCNSQTIFLATAINLEELELNFQSRVC